MAYVVTDACTKDFVCVAECSTAAIAPMSLSVLPVLFKPEERAKAIAVIMGATFVAFPLGPLLGGWLLDKFWWGSVFLINVPVVIFALATWEASRASYWTRASSQQAVVDRKK